METDGVEAASHGVDSSAVRKATETPLLMMMATPMQAPAEQNAKAADPPKEPKRLLVMQQQGFARVTLAVVVLGDVRSRGCCRVHLGRRSEGFVGSDFEGCFVLMNLIGLECLLCCGMISS